MNCAIYVNISHVKFILSSRFYEDISVSVSAILGEFRGIGIGYLYRQKTTDTPNPFFYMIYPHMIR